MYIMYTSPSQYLENIFITFATGIIAAFFTIPLIKIIGLFTLLFIFAHIYEHKTYKNYIENTFHLQITYTFIALAGAIFGQILSYFIHTSIFYFAIGIILHELGFSLVLALIINIFFALSSVYIWHRQDTRKTQLWTISHNIIASIVGWFIVFAIQKFQK